MECNPCSCYTFFLFVERVSLTPDSSTFYKGTYEPCYLYRD